MKKQSINLNIDIDPEHPRDPAKVCFSMSGSGVNGDEVYFKNDKHNDGIDVEFSIKDSTGRGYVFPNNPADPKDPTCLGQALAAKLITGPNHCPQPGETWPGFAAKEVTDKTLTVFDTNGHLQYFGFALFVVNPEDQGFIPYDPIGNNQNGGRSSRSHEIRMSRAVGVGAIALVTLALIAIAKFAR